jgi:hypothetical protein
METVAIDNFGVLTLDNQLSNAAVTKSTGCGHCSPRIEMSRLMGSEKIIDPPSDGYETMLGRGICDDLPMVRARCSPALPLRLST